MAGVVAIPEDSDVPGDDSCSAGNVHVRNLTFDYDDGTRALTEITLDIAAGEHVAVVGASGAGKTTLAAVLAGTRLPDSGSVSRPARTVVVSQEVHLFEGTLRENLTLAAPDATDDAIRDALFTTGAGAVLDELLDGLGTMLGAGGYPLTDVRAQRIVVMDSGRIIEQGTHADLVVADGMYASLWNAWKRTDSA
ncbi:ABC transporter ATP-binding protein [Corynebacterium sp.]|uniref:ABC transporter ATP-binding protein n=1 Tax=Corynebacterium sp. TaxID=1720 RepID=UPI0028AC1ED4|nr:ABC transporter ATP-binding protein [Corynebacterium sp.]